MKNPLNKRLPREFRKDFGKYLVIFLLLVITIGFVSGFLVSDGSMIKAYTEGIDNYNTENGHFRTSEKMNDAQIQSVEENGIRIYNNFYLEQDLTNGSTMRIFANREQVNLACLMEGEFPKAANEIAIDRMYADNNKISIGELQSHFQKRQMRLQSTVCMLTTIRFPSENCNLISKSGK